MHLINKWIILMTNETHEIKHYLCFLKTLRMKTKEGTTPPSSLTEPEHIYILMWSQQFLFWLVGYKWKFLLLRGVKHWLINKCTTKLKPYVQTLQISRRSPAYLRTLNLCKLQRYGTLWKGFDRPLPTLLKYHRQWNVSRALVLAYH